MSTQPSSSEFTQILVEADGPIGRLSLNRPAKRNALSTTVLDEIANAAAWFDRQDQIKVVVVTGAGDHFSAGADLAAFSGGRGSRHAGDAGRNMADALENMRPLAIASIRGWCVGGALVLAAACDLRIAAQDARFSIPEVDLGIPLAWGGIPRLVREIGPTRAKELVITCRPFDATEAASIGFLNRVVAPDALDAATQELAESIAAKAAMVLEATKRHTNAVTAQMVGIERAWSDADSLTAALGDPECQLAREAYLAQRAARTTSQT